MRTLPVRRITRAEEGRGHNDRPASPSEGVAMMWQLAMQAWLSTLSAAGVRFLIVGAHALAAHGVPRATGDLGIWVRPTSENATRVLSGWLGSRCRFAEQR